MNAHEATLKAVHGLATTALRVLVDPTFAKEVQSAFVADKANRKTSTIAESRRV